MDYTAINCAKSINDFIEHNEKRHATSQVAHEDHSSKIKDLQGKVELLENSYKTSVISIESLKNELLDSNRRVEELRQRLQESREKEESALRSIEGYKIDLQTMQTKLEECNGSISLVHLLSSEVHKLEEFKRFVESKFVVLEENQTDISKYLRKLQDKITMTSPQNNYHRIPIRSPSANSFSPVPRHTQSNLPSYLRHSPHDQYHSLDQDEVSDIGDRAEDLKNVLGQLHRSFEEARYP